MMAAHAQLTNPTAATRPGTPATFVYDRATRGLVSTGIVVVAVSATALSVIAADDRQGFVLSHALSAAPFIVGGLVCSTGVLRTCPPEYRPFWQRWFAANLVAGLATVAAIGAVLLQSPVLLLVDMVLLVAAVPFWTSAGLQMLAAHAGRRDAAVDKIDGAMAVVVLGAPGVLLLGEPVLDTAELAFAAPFALFLLLIPAGIYGAFLGLARVPRGERVAHGIGVAIAGAFAVSVALQLTRVVGAVELPLPVYIGAHALNLALIMALPLWAHRVTSGGLGRLPVERQVRRNNPMPAISAVVLPVLAGYVFARRSDDAWAVGYLAVVLLAVVVLNALRHARLGREAQSLSGELARMAEERRQLLASMVRALDDDRRRTVTELHSQAVGSLSTLGTVVQTACVSLPAATATVVRETIAQLQGDLSDRAEELRTLMVAMRPPPFDDTADGVTRPGDDPLSAALRASAAEVHAQATAVGTVRPGVQVVVDPALELDRSTMTIVYRIAQEALLNAIRHAGATLVVATVGADEHTRSVVVEVTDDGVGFDPAHLVSGSGLASMRLFTDLGRGELTVRSAPGEGTVVTSRLGVRDEACRPRETVDVRTAGRTRPTDDRVAADARPGARHLRLIPPLGPAPGQT